MTVKDDRDKEVNDLLQRLQDKVANDPQFTAADEEAIHKMLKAYRGLLAIRTLSAFTIVTLAGIATIMASYKTIMTGLKAWILG